MENLGSSVLHRSVPNSLVARSKYLAARRLTVKIRAVCVSSYHACFRVCFRFRFMCTASLCLLSCASCCCCLLFKFTFYAILMERYRRQYGLAKVYRDRVASSSFVQPLRCCGSLEYYAVYLLLCVSAGRTVVLKERVAAFKKWVKSVK